jgi:stearoyl-CoA desaturase (delta-9 desaturase)
MQTKAWAAIHRKHHAKCETDEDPHSPQTKGLKTVFWRGAELYRAEAKNQETLSKYGHGTPNDWLENQVYSAFPWQGVGLMLIIDLLLFGIAGLSIWAVQMLWIPVTAAGIINGVGHYWGYRNFEAPDASTNISPWGILIGGEELHNNHHTYPTSAKLSVKGYEFDIGWVYIRMLELLGMAHPKKTPPKAMFSTAPLTPDERTLEAMISNRYELMANYARALQATLKAEIQALPKQPADKLVSVAKRWMHRDGEKIPRGDLTLLSEAKQLLPLASSMVAMREELKALWLNTHRSREQLTQDLQAWCQRAEASGIEALRDFSRRLRQVRA